VVESPWEGPVAWVDEALVSVKAQIPIRIGIPGFVQANGHTVFVGKMSGFLTILATLPNETMNRLWMV
jgi:hypothetical protein